MASKSPARTCSSLWRASACLVAVIERINAPSAIMLALAGIVLLIPKFSADSAELSLRLLTAGFVVMIRVVIVWYLWQSSTAEKFR